MHLRIYSHFSNRWVPAALVIALTQLSLTPPVHALGNSRHNPPDSLTLKIDSSFAPKIADSDRASVETFFNEAVALLPPKIRQTLNREVTVRFEALDAAPGIFVPACVGDTPNPAIQKQVLGQVSRSILSDRRKISVLSLHQGFKSEIVAGESAARTYECGHRNLYRLALASLLHELVHLYDYADPRSSEDLATLKQCQRAQNDGRDLQDPELQFRCSALRGRHTLSTRDDFLDLMGWVETGAIFPSRKQANQSTLRSPDPYEFENPRESVAVNLEHFLMDPEFACRRPAVHAYLAEHFGWVPHPNRSCTVNTLIPVSTGYAGSAQIQASLDPSRIYQVHALFAGKGPETMSRWGHSLFRLVTCAPDRQKVGPECMNDVAHHVAISFRANVPDAAISYVKGVTGGYASMIFAQPFLGVIEEYNKGEFRELISLPLNLTEDQKVRFIHRVLEASWEYSGRYKFISNNCAVEALNFLKGSIGESALSERHPLTPIGLHKTLKKIGLVDTSVIQDLDRAVQTGHYFASKKPEVDRAFRGVTETFKQLCRETGSPEHCKPEIPAKLESFLSSTTAGERLAAYEGIWNARRETPEIARRTLGSRFFLLESYAIRKLEKSTLQLLSSVIEGERWDLVPAAARASVPRMQELVKKLRQMQQDSLPALMKTSGYGIPLKNAQPQQDAPATDPAVASELLEWAKKAFAPSFAELEAAQRNRVYFLKEMRSHLPAPVQGPVIP